MWIYNSQEINEDLIPNNAIGFVYIITNINNSKMYIGRKLLTKAGYKTINKKKIKIRKDSLWKSYYGSCKSLINDVKEIGNDSFKREILMFCSSVSELNYSESRLQFLFSVLESDKWYNQNITCRCFKKNIISKVKNLDNIFIEIAKSQGLGLATI